MQGLRMHPAGLRILHPSRQINNVYFDTPGFSTYKDNVSGLAQRKKFRVRWYGSDNLNIENAVLEIKIRDNEVGDKIIYPLDSFSFLDIKKLIRQVNSLCPETGAALRPTLFNSYNRSYLSSPDKAFRITLDTKLCYAPMMPEPFIGRQLLQETHISVLELKYDEALDSLSDRITQYLPYRRTKNSKYVSGIELCYR
jgi:hypothetical protein